jgi:translation initiation factor 6 (eIF-6)
VQPWLLVDHSAEISEQHTMSWNRNGILMTEQSHDSEEVLRHSNTIDMLCTRVPKYVTAFRNQSIAKENNWNVFAKIQQHKILLSIP